VTKIWDQNEELPEEVYDLATDIAGSNPTFGEWYVAVDSALDQLGYEV